jgi:hypothetical protein
MLGAGSRSLVRAPNASGQACGISSSLTAMARSKLRSRREVVEQAGQLGKAARVALARLPADSAEARVVEAMWQAEGLGALLWALALVDLPPFDRPFDAEWLVATPLEPGSLRARAEIEHARETARLWHWRARTRVLTSESELELPEPWTSSEQLVAVAAMRGYERGLLPAPLRGDFPAFDTGYRELSAKQHAEVLSIAYERHRAFNWLLGAGRTWAETPTDT